MVLTGCAVGPNYQRPEATTIPAAYTGVSDEWKIAVPQAHLPKGNWWEIFGDPELNRLEAEAAEANQDLKAAAARFKQARAVADVARSGLFPRLGASFLPVEQHDSENRPVGGKPGQTYDTFTVPFDLSYELDLWGRVRRTVESATAQVQASADDVESVRLAIQAEVAADYFTIRALDADKALLLSSIEVYRKSLELVRNRRAGGMVSDLDVAQAETILKTTEAQLPDNALQRAKFEHALAVLTGKNASLFRVAERPLDLAPLVIPPALPSELLERRPDIAAAERRMAAANANIGVATAAFFPTIKFSGLAGFQSGDDRHALRLAEPVLGRRPVPDAAVVPGRSAHRQPPPGESVIRGNGRPLPANRADRFCGCGKQPCSRASAGQPIRAGNGRSEGRTQTTGNRQQSLQRRPRDLSGSGDGAEYGARDRAIRHAPARSATGGGCGPDQIARRRLASDK